MVLVIVVVVVVSAVEVFVSESSSRRRLPFTPAITERTFPEVQPLLAASAALHVSCCLPGGRELVPTGQLGPVG